MWLEIEFPSFQAGAASCYSNTVSAKRAHLHPLHVVFNNPLRRCILGLTFSQRDNRNT